MPTDAWNRSNIKLAEVYISASFLISVETYVPMDVGPPTPIVMHIPRTGLAMAFGWMVTTMKVLTLLSTRNGRRWWRRRCGRIRLKRTCLSSCVHDSGNYTADQYLVQIRTYASSATATAAVSPISIGKKHYSLEQQQTESTSSTAEPNTYGCGSAVCFHPLRCKLAYRIQNSNSVQRPDRRSQPQSFHLKSRRYILETTLSVAIIEMALKKTIQYEHHILQFSMIHISIWVAKW